MKNGICEDVNECLNEQNDCSENAECTNTEGGFSCACKDGFSGNGKNCEDINECSLSATSCTPNSDCVNTIPGYTCTCKEGFEMKNGICEDVNECLNEQNDCSENAECTNTEGGFSCACKDGFSGNGKNCEDINECSLSATSCTPNSDCVNTIPGYTCTCKEGFEMKNGICEDVNECLNEQNDCSENAECTNTEGGFSCACKDGFSGNGKNCEDINECSLSATSCTPNSDCVNTIPGYTCTCKEGFEMKNGICEDVNECLNEQNDCSENAECTNTEGGFSCACKDGFSGNGKNCEDINECSLSATSCTPNSDCVNTIPGYTCTCKEGFEMKNGICEDVNECLNEQNDCSENAECTNTEGGFSCACKDGFSGNGKNCEDINECSLSATSCTPNSDCVNTIPGYTCTCKEGFEMKNGICEDVNECLNEQNDCSENAECTNTEGGFSCACKDGYSGNGRTCEDIDECTTDTYDCPEFSKCVNSPAGRYSCECKDGYKMIGNKCKLVCGRRLCVDNARCVNNRRCVCHQGYYGVGHVNCTDTCGGHECVKFSGCTRNKCKCYRNFYGDATVKCRRLCGPSKKRCDENAVCKRRKCVCNKGYIGDGTKCHKPCTCSASGHVHYRTFDGSMIRYSANCSYLLSDHTDSRDPYCDYRIIVNNEAGHDGEPVTIKSVLIEIYGQTVLLKGNDVSVDNLHTDLPYSSKTGALRISHSGIYTVVETDCHVTIQWSGKATVLVEVPEGYSPNLSGMCGNCDKEKNDYRTLNGEDVSESVDRDNKIGRSNLIPMVVDGVPQVCHADSPKLCNVGQNKIATRRGKCGQLHPDVKASRFLKCIEADRLLAQDMYNVCVQDYCHSIRDRKVRDQVLCNVLEGYAAWCSRMNTLARWRMGLCRKSIKCQKRSAYRAVTKGCANSCVDRNAAPKCTRPKVDGCVCKRGFIESGDTCVRKRNCGCQENGRYFKLNTIRRTSDCTRVEKCMKRGNSAQFEVIHSDEGCSQWATCSKTDGVYNCVCLPGFTGDGFNTCTPETTCAVSESIDDCIATVKLTGRCIYKSKHNRKCDYFVYTMEEQSYIHFTGMHGHVTLMPMKETYKDCASFSLDHVNATVTIKEPVCACPPGH
ncbi:fibrillin-1-like [Argopecten irradians]|uniref:fibrillin-1-like n=1 Tax=Argopecten irradians TaxID=31199 RepID=UPI00371D86B2